MTAAKIVPGWPVTRAGQNELARKVTCPQCRATPREPCAHHLSDRPCGTHAARRHAAKTAVAAGELNPGYDWQSS